MGISYDEANNLIKKGRGRKDGGSQILESNMKKMRGFEHGGSHKMELPKPKPKIKMELPQSKPDKETRKNLGDADTRNFDDLDFLNKHNRKLDELKKKPSKEVKAASGKYMSCRGMGAAIQGGNFSGVK